MRRQYPVLPYAALAIPPDKSYTNSVERMDILVLRVAYDARQEMEPSMYTHEQYERALKRAHDEGCVIVGDSISPDGRRAWDVFNPKYTEGWYVCRQARPGAPITCSCEAGRHAVLCKHACLVIEALNEPLPPERRTVGSMRVDRVGQGSLWV